MVNINDYDYLASELVTVLKVAMVNPDPKFTFSCKDLQGAQAICSDVEKKKTSGKSLFSCKDISSVLHRAF